jgi:hypothetical protein
METPRQAQILSDWSAGALPGGGGGGAAAAAVSRSCACIGSPCLRLCVHGASIGGGGGEVATARNSGRPARSAAVAASHSAVGEGAG